MPHDHASHHHAHHAHDRSRSSDRVLGAAIALNAAIVAAETGAGLAGGSMALIADAGHNLADVAGLVAALVAGRLARRPPTERFTYGLGGATILAALGNACLLLLVTSALALASAQRLLRPEPVAASLVVAVALAAIVVNGVSAWLLAPKDRHGDLNLRGAAAHLAADAAVAASVVAAAVAVALTGWRWIDPALGLAISAAIVVGTWRLLREAVALSLAAVPPSVEAASVRAALGALPGVAALHDLHIWPMSTAETALTAHLVMPGGHPGDGFLMETCTMLRERFRIGHATLQVETDEATTCRLAPAEVV